MIKIMCMVAYFSLPQGENSGDTTAGMCVHSCCDMFERACSSRTAESQPW